MINDILLPCSFKGVPFYFKRHDVEGGRKTVIQEFPDSDRRYIQDLGKLNKSFSITGFTTGQDLFYLIERDALIFVLESSGPGILTHPYFGAISVTALNYSLYEENTNQGIATFQINFSVSQTNLTPSVTSNVLGIITEYGLATIDLIASNVNSGYKVSQAYPNNYFDAATKIIDLGVLFGTNVSLLNSNPDNIDNFNSTLISYNENAITYTSNPQELSFAITNLFAQANTLPLDAKSSVNFFQLFFNFGEDDPFLPTITAQQQERQKNRDLLNVIVQLSALCYAYMNASLIGYTTTNDIALIESILEVEYERVTTFGNIDPTVFNTLQNLRATMFDFFKNAEIAAFKIAEVETKEMPIQVFTYQYYGTLDQNQNLIDLNGINDTSFIPTTMEVLVF